MGTIRRSIVHHACRCRSDVPKQEVEMRVLTAAILILSATVVQAQSLGDVARREAARRKTVKAPGKVFTNDDLKVDPRDVASLPPSPMAPPSDDTPAEPAPSGKAGGGATPAQGANDEKAWRGRVQGARDGLARAQVLADALQSRINALSADFTSRDDPAQRATIATDRQRALDELERVKKDVQTQTKALADVQEEGRKAGIPAGWLR
jgi:hypothetical protein